MLIVPTTVLFCKSIFTCRSQSLQPDRVHPWGVWDTAAGGTISLAIPSSATALQTRPEENDLISLLHFPDLQNRANFAYLRGAGKGLVLAKELKLAQMQDATDAQDDDSGPSLR